MSEQPEDNSKRYCPICEEWMVDEICPVDQVPTIKKEILEEQSSTIPNGTILGGRYEVQRLIGMGGMGAVYLGNQTNIHRRVAIKTLKKELMSNERLLKRFDREARAAAALDHPNIVKVYDFGLDSDLGCPYIAMEYLEGRSLDALIEERKQVNEERACLIMGSVARALTDAHSKGVVHRDLKPDNVHVQTLSDGTEHIKVLDFGIAKIRHPDGTPTEKLTGTGMALGTPYYMSPEQAMGKAADFRSDLYAIGCILYQLVSGRMPFDAEQPMAVLLKQLREPAPPLPEVLCDGRAPSAGLRSLYSSLMAKRPEERPSSTLAVADQLKLCVQYAQGKEIDDGAFIFGGKTLGPVRDQSQENRGLETLLGDSVGEKETLSFGALTSGESAGASHGGDSSDGELADVNGDQRRIPMIIAAAVLLAGGSLAYFLSGEQTPTGEVSQTQGLAPRSATAGSPAGQTTAKTTYRFTINSEPVGAEVRIDGQVAGVTPYQGERAKSAGKAKVEIRLTGYTSADKELSESNTALRFKLKELAVKKVEPQSTKTSRSDTTSSSQSTRNIGQKRDATKGRSTIKSTSTKRKPEAKKTSLKTKSQSAAKERPVERKIIRRPQSTKKKQKKGKMNEIW